MNYRNFDSDSWGPSNYIFLSIQINFFTNLCEKGLGFMTKTKAYFNLKYAQLKNAKLKYI